MEKKKIEAENPISVAGITLIPIVRVSINHWHSKNGLSFFASKEPIAITVVSPRATKAFRITGEEVSLEELIKEVPEIKEVLERL